MTQNENQAAEPAAVQQPEDLEVQVAWDLLERGRAEGVSLVGPGGLLAGVKKLDADRAVLARSPRISASARDCRAAGRAHVHAAACEGGAGRGRRRRCAPGAAGQSSDAVFTSADR